MLAILMAVVRQAESRVATYFLVVCLVPFQSISPCHLNAGKPRTMPRRGSGHTAPGLASLPAPVPEGVGYAIGYRRPNMAFHETRQASQYLEDLRGVLELTVRI